MKALNLSFKLLLAALVSIAALTPSAPATAQTITGLNVSPLVSNVSPDSLRKIEGALMRQAEVKTSFDGLNTPLAATHVLQTTARSMANPNATPAPVSVSSTVQTMDYTLASESSTGVPPASGSPTNIDPVWSPDASFLVFSSNMTTGGAAGANFHLWAVAASGGPAVQLTTGSGDERWPTLISDTQIAYCESTNNGTSYQLATATVSNSSTGAFLPSLSNATTVTFTDINGNPITDVRHPSWVGDLIAFSGLSNQSPTHHIYYYSVSNGISSGQAAQLTSGSADEEDPSVNTVGNLIAFDSNAAANYTYSSTASTPLSFTGSPAAVRNVFVAVASGVGGTLQYTQDAGTNNIEPTWSYVPPSLVVPTGYYLWFSSNRTATGNYGIYYDFALATNGTQVYAENNEPYSVQTISIGGGPTGGTFSLTYDGATVTGIPYNATALTVQNALQGLSSVTANQQTVTVTIDPSFAQAYDVSFSGPAVVPVGQITGSSQMTGGTPTITVTTSGTQNPAVALLTSDPSTNSPIGGFNNYEPAVPELQQNFYNVAYVSPRFIVNNVDDNPLDNAGAPPAGTTDAEPINTAASPAGVFNPANSSLAPTGGFEILASEFFDINPPALLRYSTAQIISTFNNADTSKSPVRFIPAGGTVNFTVRLSERQAGVGQVYLQIKNPNSKYQGQDGLEHKVFTHLSPKEGGGYYVSGTTILSFPYLVDPNNPGTTQVHGRDQFFAGNPLRDDMDEATHLFTLQPAEGGQGVDLGQMLTYTPEGLTQQGPTPGTMPRVNDGNVDFATISANAAAGATSISLSYVNALGISAVSYVNQTLTVNGSPTAGTFTITYDGDTTNPIPYNTVASGVQDAINNLPNIQAANMFATVNGNTITPTPPNVSGPFTINLPGADSAFVIDSSQLVPSGVAQVDDSVQPGQSASFYGDPYHLAGAILQLYDSGYHPVEKVQILSSNYAYPGATPWGGTFNVTPLEGNYTAGALPAGYAAIVKLSEFDPQGSEVDCQSIDAGTTSQITALSAASLSPYYQIPPYTPGYSDAAPLLGVGAQGDGSLENSPPVNPNTGDDVWLPLTQVPSDGQGGVLYQATWATPTEPSDYYIDVVAYDNSETNPYIQQVQGYAGQNWRIFDNVWGITTQPFVAHTSPSGILVVNDYMLPQKFFNGQRFGTLANGVGPSNIPVNYFGSESYLTDIDTKWSDTNGLLASLPSAGYILNNTTTATMTQLYHAPQGSSSNLIEGYTPFYPNGLGVNSYLDDDQANPIQVDTQPADALDIPDISNGIATGYNNGADEAPSQSYDIWRILSRGAIPETILDAYGAQQTPQPANPLVTGSTASNILAAPSCVLWSSPFAGDEFADSGTIVDPLTQGELTRFVNNGGRLLVEGIDVGFALTGGGLTPTDFYSDILDAKFEADSAQLNSGAAILTLNGSANQTDYISKDAFINSDGGFADQGLIGHDNFAYSTSVGTIVYTPPSSAPLQLVGVPPVVGESGNPANRTDGSLADGGSDYLSFVDAFSNLGTAPPATGLITSLPVEATELKGSGADDQLVYTEFAPPTGVTFGGGIAAYASFGLESLSQEVAEITSPYPIFSVYAQRTNLLHNLICFMRTGTLTGQVTSANGGGAVSGAIVIATPEGTTGQSFTGTTNSSGAYSILGVLPGKYDVVAYSPGTDFYQHNNGSAVYVHGGDTGNLNIQVSPSQPGALTVEVEDASNKLAPIGGATVNVFLVATPLATTPQYTGTTGVSTGLVNFGSVTAGSYLVFASASGYATNTTGVGVVVTPQGNTPSGTLIVTLTKSPGSVTGLVTNTSGADLQGATITVTAVTPTTGGPYQATTNASGGYTVPNVPPGTYSVSAADTSYITQTQTPITVASGVPVTVNFTLSTSPTTTLYGYVSRTDTGAAVASGATVTFTDKSNSGNVQTATTVATFSGPDGKPANYRIPNMPYGTYTGVVNASGLGSLSLASPVTVNTPTSQRVDFTYQLSVIYGLVSQSANSTAITGATVTLTPASGTALTATTVAPFTGPDGKPANFEFASPVPYGSYTASVVATGYPTPANQAITVNSGQQRVNFAVQPIHSFAGGLQMFSLPFDYTSSSDSLSQIFGYTNPKIALWEPNQNSYTFPSTIQIGVGYWVRFPAAEGLLLAGTPVANTKAVSISLTPGWNMIGDPYASALPLSSISISDSAGNTMPIAAAAASGEGLISSTYYTYDTGTGQYDSFSATAPGNSLQAYSGYWIQAFSSATIVLGPLQ